MGKSSEEFIKQRERVKELTPPPTPSFDWECYFKSLHKKYIKKNEKINI